MSEITKALVKFQKTAPIVVKNKHVSAGAKQYRYADLAEVITTIREALADAGLAFSQSIENNGITTLVTHLYHESGESIESRMPLPIEQLQPQAVGSLLSYYRRYSLTSLLGVVIDDEDDDGQRAQDDGVRHKTNHPSGLSDNKADTRFYREPMPSQNLTQQLKDSVAAENGKKNYDTPALPEHVNDPKFHTLVGEERQGNRPIQENARRIGVEANSVQGRGFPIIQ